MESQTLAPKAQTLPRKAPNSPRSLRVGLIYRGLGFRVRSEWWIVPGFVWGLVGILGGVLNLRFRGSIPMMSFAE